MSFIDNFDLIKAKRDTTKLVQVQRTISRRGKMFTQNFWVKPSDVKPTDNVIGGQQNLLPPKPTVTKPPKGTLDSTYFDSIKSDKKLALDYLKECGITWNDHSHTSINWMRAMQAYSNATGVRPQNKQKTVPQTNPQPQSQTLQIPQTPQSGSPSPKVVLTPTQQDEVNNGKNGKEKTVILKKLLGNDRCVEYAKDLGVTWDENPHVSINIMRMSVALKNHFDLVDGTVSPATTKVKKDDIPATPTSGSGDIGAPKGNDNAKKDVKDLAALPIPDGATEREINIINLINKLTNEDEINMYKSVGMIAEDDVSKDFISDKLSPKYSLWKSAHGTSKQKAKSTTKLYGNTAWGFSDMLSQNLGIIGCKKDVVAKGFYSLYSYFDMGTFVDPRFSLVTPLDTAPSSAHKITTVGILRNLQNLSTYATEKFDQDTKTTIAPTSLGYTGWDSKELEERYNLENEGFVRVLRKIEKDNPELESECSKMINTYDKIMNLVGKNPKMLDKVMSSYYWNSAEEDVTCDLNYFRLSSSYFHDEKRCNQKNAIETLRVVDNNIKTIPAALEKLGFDSEAIEFTLTRGYWGSKSLEDFEVYDKNAVSLGRVDLTSILNPDGSPMILLGTNRFGEKGTISEDTLELARAHYTGDTERYQYKAAKQSYDKCQALANFSEDNYKEVHKLLADLMGMSYVDEFTGDELDWSDLDVTRAFSGKLRIEKKNAPPELDKVLSNLIMANLGQIMNTSVALSADQNTRNSTNDYGDDYSRNFNFYTPEYAADRRVSKRTINTGRWDMAPLSADELNNKIKDQINSLPNFSSEYIDDVTSYYSAASNYTDAGKAARTGRFHSVGVNLPDYVDSPLKDVLSKMSKNLVKYIPTMIEKKGKGTETLLNSFIDTKLDYVPFNYKTGVQTSLSENAVKKSPRKTAVSSLKTLRKELLKATNCTISVEDDKTSLQMRKDFMKNWDYDGKSKPKIYSGSNSFQGADRRALFNSRFFKVNNSSFTKNFEDLVSKTGQTPEEHYHATSYASTAGILGVSGGWNIGKGGYVKTARALGHGAYFGRKGGKSSVYCGEGSGGYHDLNASGAIGDNANGCYILTSLIQGEQGDSSVSNGFREYEIVVRNNSCLLPHHFVDISCRSLGVNVQRDSRGNYIDSHGNVTHDRYATKLDIK